MGQVGLTPSIADAPAIYLPGGWQLCRVMGGSFREMGGSLAVKYAR